MKIGKVKLGRNDLCSCGSGKKYKRCCLTSVALSQKKPLVDPDLIQKSMLSLKNRVQANMGETYIMHDGELKIKMSEVILDLAEDLLESAETKAEYHSVIAITCLAWNLATVNSADYGKSLERRFSKIDDELCQKDALKIINELVEKKNCFYPDINRIILDFDLVGNKGSFHLNIVSTMSQEEVAELDL